MAPHKVVKSRIKCRQGKKLTPRCAKQPHELESRMPNICKDRFVRTRSTRLNDDQNNLIQEKLSNNVVNNSRVQWTREFMEKVRKSNEKALMKTVKGDSKKVGAKIDKNPGREIGNKICGISQEEVQVEGDRIKYHVDPVDMEELDYEDDMSMEEDITPDSVVIQELHDEEMGDGEDAPAPREPQPGTSG